MNINSKWVLCPVCGSKTRNRIREDNILKNYPLYCPKCKQECLIEAKNLQITVIKEPHGCFSGAVLIKAFAVALTTSNDRS